MIQLIKAFWKPVLVLLVVIILSDWIWNNYNKPNPPTTGKTYTQADIENAKARVIDSIYDEVDYDSIAIFQAGKDAKAAESIALRSREQSYKKGYERWKHITDSLLLVTKIDSGCKKIVKSQQNQIDSLNGVVETVGQEAENYSRRLYFSEKQNEKKDSIITRRDKTIDRIENERSDNQCYKNWFDSRPFWKWVHNPKCR